MSENQKAARIPQHGGGPKTPEGKARSAQNSTRHGLSAKAFVLVKTEDPAMFNELLSDYLAEFKPRTKFELDLVHELAACRWRMQRAWAIESNLFHVDLLRNEDNIAREFPYAYTNNMRTAITFTRLADNTRSFSLLLRYERALSRRFHEILQELEALRSQPPAEDYETNSPEAPPEVPPPSAEPPKLEIVSPEPEKPAARTREYVFALKYEPPFRR